MIKFFILEILFLLSAISNAIADDAIFNIIQNVDLDAFNQSKDQISDWGIKDDEGNSLIIAAFQTLSKIDKVNKGKTALHYSVMNNDISMAQMLIENGADVHVKDENENTPYLLARKMGYHEIADLILNSLREKIYNENSNGLDINDKNIAGENEYLKKRKNIISIIFSLIEKCENINAPDKNGKYPLHYAVLSGNYDLVKELIDKKIDINVRDQIKSSTPLIMAAGIGEWHIVNLLLENHADINIREKEQSPEISNNKNGTVRGEEYLKPDEYNFKFIVYSEGIDGPGQDVRTYYQIFIDKQEQGRTSIGLDLQKKEYTALLSVNRHLIEVAKYCLDRKQEKYIKLKNIDQPNPNYFYFSIPEDRIVVLSLEHDNADRKAGYSLHYVKKNDIKSGPD